VIKDGRVSVYVSIQDCLGKVVLAKQGLEFIEVDSIFFVMRADIDPNTHVVDDLTGADDVTAGHGGRGVVADDGWE